MMSLQLALHFLLIYLCESIPNTSGGSSGTEKPA